MKIAVSSCGIFLDSPIDPRFGRCDYFVIVDPDDMSLEAFENLNGRLTQGAGVQSANFVISKGAQVVIARNIGPNAINFLSEAGVEVVLCHADSVKEAIEKYRKGLVENAKAASVRGHYGMIGKSAGNRMKAPRMLHELKEEEKTLGTDPAGKRKLH